MSDKEWIEGRQRFRYRGVCIETTKPATLRLSYGDERVRELREERELAERKRREKRRSFFSLRIGIL